MDGQFFQPRGPGRGVQGRIEIVEDVVGVAGEAIQRVDRRALIRR
jgi:hypothetical protein